jgi:hypothetical protein
MATKKKTKKNQTKSERTVGKKVAPMKLGKWVTPKKKLPKNKKKTAPKNTEVKTKAGGKKTTGGKTAGALKKQVQGKSQSVGTVAFALERLGARPGEQSGDLQGLSNVQRADSESVDELLEQGNAFEAEVVKGVEDAGDTDEGEVRTHEVPQQDDVPGEYLGKE